MDQETQNLLTKFKYLKTIFDTFSCRQKNAFVKNLTDEQTRFFIELAYNIQYKTFKLNENQLKSLEKHKNKLMKILDTKVSFKRKKKYMTGGLIASLIATLGAAIFPVIIDEVKKKFEENNNE